jgi:hypothetical protein
MLEASSHRKLGDPSALIQARAAAPEFYFGSRKRRGVFSTPQGYSPWTSRNDRFVAHYPRRPMTRTHLRVKPVEVLPSRAVTPLPGEYSSPLVENPLPGSDPSSWWRPVLPGGYASPGGDHSPWWRRRPREAVTWVMRLKAVVPRGPGRVALGRKRRSAFDFQIYLSLCAFDYQIKLRAFDFQIKLKHHRLRLPNKNPNF